MASFRWLRLACVLCIGSALSAQAQDLHHSLYWMNPIAVNPAATGFYNGEFRCGSYARSQWLSVTVPYMTTGFWADAPVWKRRVQQDVFSLGVSADLDQAGDAKFLTVQPNLYLSYAKGLNRRNNHFLSLGLVMGYAQKRLHPDEFMHDDQYLEGKYDPGNPSQEQYASSSFGYADVGAGLQWFYEMRNGVQYYAGLSALHLNHPPQSLLKDASITLPVRYNTLFQVKVPFDAYTYVQPSLYISRQDVYSEVMAGLLGAYALQVFRNRENISMLAGIDYRLGDALFVVMGGEWKSVQLLVSYDFNVSSLSTASHGRGGVEVNLQYIYKRPRMIRRHKIPCPVF